MFMEPFMKKFYESRLVKEHTKRATIRTPEESRGITQKWRQIWPLTVSQITDFHKYVGINVHIVLCKN